MIASYTVRAHHQNTYEEQAIYSILISTYALLPYVILHWDSLHNNIIFVCHFVIDSQQSPESESELTKERSRNRAKWPACGK